ncbi:hypothetical protein [Jeongeupia sp. USM3]|uniref:hypothetical protein n=1 Tax=Jeongeupia sp. USM3 TaxID=1906741 RepID=UPI00089DEC3E|nr:hypothetical protein [Jeongeupia sp. USM3]AOX99925.1 hypothetical protein BJP62_05300 [Jeongeupia sp. USM3]
MILNLSILTGLAVLWLGVLGFVIPFNASAISAPRLFGLLVLPPMLFALGIALWRRWRAAKEQADQEAEAAAQAAAQTERVAQARASHDAELCERQHAVDCRAVWVDVIADPLPAWCDDAPAQTAWLASEPADGEEERAQALSTALAQVFEAALAEAPGLAYLPLYVLAGHAQDGRAMLEQTRTAWIEAAEASGLELPVPTGKFLPGNGSINDRVIALLRNDPTQPGLLVLGCDSPLAAQPEADEFDPVDPQQAENQRWSGQPGQAVVLQLFTRPGLQAAEAGETSQDQADPYQPYWERTQQRDGDAGGWGRVPAEWQAGLMALAPIARVHQSRELYQEDGLAKGNKLSQQLRGTVEAALINAALRPLPFDPAEAGDDQSHELAWLVHNCGGVDVGGSRLAAVATVLSYFQSELNPINDASNVVTEFGDVGGARGALLNAIAITRAAALQKPVLIAEFGAHNQMIASVIRHAATEEASA